jgi:hypothetical protein
LALDAELPAPPVVPVIASVELEDVELVELLIPNAVSRFWLMLINCSRLFTFTN